MMKSLDELIHQRNNDSTALTRQQGLLPATQQRITALISRYPSLTQLSADYNPDKGSRYALYPTRCIVGNAPSLVDVSNAYGNSASVQWLMVQIVAYQESINTPNKMTVAQYTNLAQVMAREFYHLKCSEFLLFFANLTAGKYNIDYHGYVSPDIILDALRNQYIPYRWKVMQDENDRQQKERERKEKSRDTMSREEWEEIKMLTSMYEMEIPNRQVSCATSAGK